MPLSANDPSRKSWIKTSLNSGITILRPMRMQIQMLSQHLLPTSVVVQKRFG